MRKLLTITARSAAVAYLSVIAAGTAADTGPLQKLHDARDAMAAQGITAELGYVSDIFSNVHGGVDRETEVLGNLDLIFNIDAEALWGLSGASINLHFLGNHGGSPTDHVGDVQTVSNIDAPQAFKLYEASYEQQLSGDRASLKFGLYDLNSEFDVIESAGLFLNSSFGIGPDFAQSGLNGPSIFPTTSLAMRFAVQMEGGRYAQMAVLDGVPGDPDNPRGTHIDLDPDEGWLLAGEAGYQAGLREGQRYRKIALGTWRYTEKFDQWRGLAPSGAPQQHASSGFYILGEVQALQEQDDPEQGLTIFARYGMAEDEVNPFGSYWGAGAVYTGLFDRRHADQIGLAVAHVRSGDEFRALARDMGNPLQSAETAIELSYRAQISDWFALQPDIQYVIDPGMDPELDNALTIGLRLEIGL